MAICYCSPVFAQDRKDEVRSTENPGFKAGEIPPTPGPVAPDRSGGATPVPGSPAPGSPAAPKKQAFGMDSGIATLPAASNHQNAMKAGPEVDVLFNLIIGRIVESTKVKNATTLSWLERILSPALGFDGRYIRPLGAGFRAAAGLKGELFFRSSGSQNASVGFTSSNQDKGSDKKFDFVWDSYAVSTWQKGPLRLHAGGAYGTSASWVGVLSEDLGPLKGSTGFTPFFGADFKVSSKGRRVRLELMAPLAYEKPPLAIFTKADNLFQFNVGWIKSEHGYAVLGYFDQRFGVVPPQPKAKPGEPAAAPVPGARSAPPGRGEGAASPSPSVTAASGLISVGTEGTATPTPGPSATPSPTGSPEASPTATPLGYISNEPSPTPLPRR